MTNPNASALHTLRQVVPTRSSVTFDEALRVAELQAAKLRARIGSGGTLEDRLQVIPRLRVVYEPLSVSGLSYWNGTEWIIAINSHDSWARQRFTICHELKHVIDHGHVPTLYRGGRRASWSQQAERAADYFAGCLLMPKRELKSLWGSGVQRASDLANHFGVSTQAVEVRLKQTGLAAAADLTNAGRCARPIHTAPDQAQQFRIPVPSYVQRSC